MAAGRADGYFQRNLNYWDIAAGIIILKEAGGLICDYSGKNENSVVTDDMKIVNDVDFSKDNNFHETKTNRKLVLNI